MQEIVICVKQLGKKASIIKDKNLQINVSSGHCTLQDIIHAIVEAEGNNHNQKIGDQISGSGNSIKTPEDILIHYGKITFGDTYNTELIDINTAQGVAIQAFTDGLFSVFYGDDEISSLEDTIYINKGKVFSFIRLTFLTGSYW